MDIWKCGYCHSKGCCLPVMRDAYRVPGRMCTGGLASLCGFASSYLKSHLSTHLKPGRAWEAEVETRWSVLPEWSQPEICASSSGVLWDPRDS